MKLCDFGQSGPPGDAWSAWKSRPKITVMGKSSVNEGLAGKIIEVKW
jgi:hypothetical protein